jgi:hypothetical protein
MIYTPYHLSQSIRVGRDYDAQYGVRVGGSGGRIIGSELLLNRDQAVLLCSLLEQAHDAGREERIAA